MSLCSTDSDSLLHLLWTLKTLGAIGGDVEAIFVLFIKIFPFCWLNVMFCLLKFPFLSCSFVMFWKYVVPSQTKYVLCRALCGAYKHSWLLRLSFLSDFLRHYGENILTLSQNYETVKTVKLLFSDPYNFYKITRFYRFHPQKEFYCSSRQHQCQTINPTEICSK